MFDRAGHSLAVPAAWMKPVEELVGRNAMGIRLVARGGGVRVTEPKRRRGCTVGRLYVGGWIGCPTARRLAALLDLRPRKLGALLNLLRIKVRHCDLNCF